MGEGGRAIPILRTRRLDMLSLMSTEAGVFDIVVEPPIRAALLYKLASYEFSPVIRRASHRYTPAKVYSARWAS